MDFKTIALKVSDTARTHGFWDVDVSNSSTIDRKLLLIIGEIVEAQEDLRRVGLGDYEEIDDQGLKKPCGFATELADAVIRIMDLAAQLDIPLEQYILTKDSYNETRPHKHGKRF